MTTKKQYKPLVSLLLIFGVAPLLAVLVSPWVYQWIQRMSPDVMQWVQKSEAAGVHTFWADIADSIFTASFRRVTARIVLIMALLMLGPTYRLSGLRTRENFGLPCRSNRFKLIRMGLVLAIVSMSMVYTLGVFLGVYAWDVGGGEGSYILAQLLKIAIGGMLIGLFEEILFRGFIFSALRKSLGLLASILWSSVLFAIVHFIKPVDLQVTDQWYSGLLLFGHLFSGVSDTFLQEACTLFCMGAVLATLSGWTKSVYLSIGLHAGWVWVMMCFRLFTENQGNLVWLYGTSDWLPNSWMGPMMALIVLVAVVLTRKKWIALAGVTEDERKKKRAYASSGTLPGRGGPQLRAVPAEANDQ